MYQVCHALRNNVGKNTHALILHKMGGSCNRPVIVDGWLG